MSIERQILERLSLQITRDSDWDNQKSLKVSLRRSCDFGSTQIDYATITKEDLLWLLGDKE